MIAGCLLAQLYAMVRPNHDRFWPFVAYRMFAQAHAPGETFHALELRARACGARPGTWRVAPREIGYQQWTYLADLEAIVSDRPAATSARERISRIARTYLARPPCALEVWRWDVRLTPDGVDRASLVAPRWRRLQTWRVDGTVFPTALEPR